MRNRKYSPCPVTQNKLVLSSKGVEVMVCGLDHSGSQPFNYGKAKKCLLSHKLYHISLSPLPYPASVTHGRITR